MLRRTLSILSVSVIALVLGCEGAVTNEIAVTGDVSFDGSPVQEGDIIFLAADGVSGSGAGKIVAGTYAVKMTPGEKIVEIRASRILTGEDPNNPGSAIPRTEMYLPAKYNAASELKQTIPPAGGEIDFDLKK